MRLRADAKHKIFFDADAGTVVKVVRWPVNFPLFTVVQTHYRPLPVKIVKLLGIDSGKFFTQQLIDQISDRGRRRGAGVTPAGE